WRGLNVMSAAQAALRLSSVEKSRKGNFTARLTLNTRSPARNTTAACVSMRLTSAPPCVVGSASRAKTGSCESGASFIGCANSTLDLRPSYRQATGAGRVPGRSLLRLLEITQIRRRLVLAGRHEQAVGAEHVILPADADMRIVLGTDFLDPIVVRIGVPGIFLLHAPWPGQRMVDGGDFVPEHRRIGLVEIEPFLHHGLIIAVQRQTGGVVGARPLHAAGLDFQHVVAAIAILVDPVADGIALECRLELLRPIPPVRLDAVVVA